MDFIKNNVIEKNDDYSKFLSNYLGYVGIPQRLNNLKYTLVLKLEAIRNYLTFQAFPIGKNTFTTHIEKLYYSLNQTMVLFNYTASQYERTRNEFDKLKIETLEDYNKNMHLFSAEPEFELSFDNNMPWFEKYIVKLNGEIIKVKNQKCLMNLKDGISTIEVVAVNKNSIEGIPTIIKIKYE